MQRSMRDVMLCLTVIAGASTWALGQQALHNQALHNQALHNQALSDAPAPLEVRAQFPEVIEAEREMFRRNLGAWWGAVGAVRDGKVVYARGFGFAGEDLQPLTSQSLFDLGALSMQFTGACVIALDQDGVLSVDDPLSKFYPDLSERHHKITLRHLMNHTAGLSDQTAGFAPSDLDDRDAVVKALLELDLRSEPGALFEFSARGYTILAAVIEKAAGKPFETVMRERVFARAGLKSTGFADGQGLDLSRAAIRVATGRRGEPGRSQLVASAQQWNWGVKGGAGVISCLDDLLAWDIALSDDRVLDAAHRELQLTPARQSYAAGWHVTTTARNTRQVWHGGGTPGQVALIYRYVDEGLSLVTLTNELGEPDSILNAFQRPLLKQYPESVKGFIDATGLSRTPDRRGVIVDGDIRWSLDSTPDNEVQVRLARAVDDAQLSQMLLGEGTARRLLATLKDILKYNTIPEGPSITGLTLGNKANQDVVDFSDLMWAEVRPVLRVPGPDGKPVNDPRPTLIVMDGKSQQWPLVVRLSRPDAEELSLLLQGWLDRVTAKPDRP